MIARTSVVLPGAVGPENSNEFARVDRRVDAGQNLIPAQGDRQVGDLQRGRHGWVDTVLEFKLVKTILSS